MSHAVSTPRRCPCGSRDHYADCCGALHRGRAAGDPTAETAEELMRSRFSAFAVGDVDYLLATWHPSTRPSSLDLETGVEWLRLEILDTRAGTVQDDTGEVEFAAHFWTTADRQRGLQRERSTFHRERGQWFYIGEAEVA